MYKLSKLNHHNTYPFELTPGMTTIRFDDCLATTAHRCHVPQTFNMQCVIPFHPFITNFCTCKSSYSGNASSPNLPTDDILIMLNWIKVKRFGWPRQNISSMSLQKKLKVVCCGMRSRIILHQAHTPVMSKKFVQTHIPACRHVPCYSNKILKEDKLI